MKPGVAARIRAADIVRRVTDEGAHSNVLVGQLDELPPRERGSAQRQSLDALRYLPRVDDLIGRHSSRPLDDLDPTVRASLRVAVAELVTGGDPHGVVDSAVEAVRRSGQPKATGFTNAVLRNVIRSGFDTDNSALASGTPQWMHERLGASWGVEEAEQFFVAALEPARIGVRIRPGTDPTGTEPIDGIPGAAWADDRSVVNRGMAVMDPASTAVTVALDVNPGDHVIDLAAAPGNKTLALSDALHGSGSVVAVDLHPRRLASMQRRFHRAASPPAFVRADAAAPPFPPATFDRVLLDAPCTGLGTIRRRPEIKTRLKPESPAGLGAVQRRLLERALELTRPGGRVVYSVCTVFDEETVDVVTGLGGRAPTDLPGRALGDGWLLAPHLTGTDGMFICVFDI